MSLQQVKTAVLKELYKDYLEKPGGLSDVTDIIKNYSIDPVELGQHLSNYGLIKNHRFTPMGGLIAQISNSGIMEIEPDYFIDLSNKVIYALAETDESEIMEILQWKEDQFTRAFDLAKYMESTGFVKTLFLASEVRLELSLEGRDYYENNKADFLE